MNPQSDANLFFRYRFERSGSNILIRPLAKLVACEKISLGNFVIIDDFVYLNGGGGTVIGNFVHIGAYSSISGGGTLVMHDFSGLSLGVRLFTGNEDYSGDSMTNPTVPAEFRNPIIGKIHLHKFAVVGANAVILPNVTLGEGCVVGANTLIVHDCEPWTVYLGNPARPVRTRKAERLRELEKELMLRVTEQMKP